MFEESLIKSNRYFVKKRFDCPVMWVKVKLITLIISRRHIHYTCYASTKNKCISIFVQPRQLSVTNCVYIFDAKGKGKGPHPVDRVTYGLCPLYSFTLMH